MSWNMKPFIAFLLVTTSSFTLSHDLEYYVFHHQLKKGIPILQVEQYFTDDYINTISQNSAFDFSPEQNIEQYLRLYSAEARCELVGTKSKQPVDFGFHSREEKYYITYLCGDLPEVQRTVHYKYDSDKDRWLINEITNIDINKLSFKKCCLAETD